MLAAFVMGLGVSLFYGTFLEWFIHRVVMHSTFISKLAFERHAIEHHTNRRSLKTFYAKPEENVRYQIMESSIIPLLWLGHLPLYMGVGYLAGTWVGVGAAVGGLLYLFGYEFIHFFIHVPRNYRWQKTRVWRFYCEYHRIHHHKARTNYNVVCPLADIILRTINLDTMVPEQNRPEWVTGDTGPKAVWSK